MRFEFALRFRHHHEEEGRGSLAFAYTELGRSLGDVVHRAIRDVHHQHPDAIFDALIYYSKPE